MLYFVLALIFFALLAIVRELHTIISRLIEIGTLVEHFNRRDLRASGAEDRNDDDFASESITKAHHSWIEIVLLIFAVAIAATLLLKLVG